MARETVLFYQGTDFLPTVPFVRGVLVKAEFVIITIKWVREGGSSRGKVCVISILYFSQ